MTAAPTFAKAKLDARKRLLPQCIAHRGYRAKFPENSMLSFSEALKVGAQALETDIHYTKDEVVVLSHDATLKRCFGRKDKIADRTWDELKDLRTLAEPHVPMPTLRELLEYLAQPGAEDSWVLLDIKADNDTDKVMQLIAKTVTEVAPAASRPWEERVVLGIWAANFLPPAIKYLPMFPTVFIGASISYARQFFTVPKIGFNILLPMLLGPGGRSFIRECQEKDRQLLAWTVNDAALMRWCIMRKVDGVITDDPAKFLRVRDEFDERETSARIPFRTIIGLVRTWVTITFLVLTFYRRFRKPVLSPELVKKARLS